MKNIKAFRKQVKKMKSIEQIKKDLKQKKKFYIEIRFRTTVMRTTLITSIQIGEISRENSFDKRVEYEIEGEEFTVLLDKNLQPFASVDSFWNDLSEFNNNIVIWEDVDSDTRKVVFRGGKEW